MSAELLPKESIERMIDFAGFGGWEMRVVVALFDHVFDLRDKLASAAASSSADEIDDLFDRSEWPPAPPAKQKERAAFEAWAKREIHGVNLEWTDSPVSAYLSVEARGLWKAWQAARSVPRPALTDAQIQEIWTNNGGGLAANRFFQFARAIERALRGGGS